MTIHDAPPLAAVQRAACERHRSAFVPSDPESKIGLARQSLGKQPIHGLRSSPTGDWSGWMIWGGEYSSANDFFQTVCVKHLAELCPGALRYLALAPGFGFIFDESGYEDVWFDPERLEREQREKP